MQWVCGACAGLDFFLVKYPTFYGRYYFIRTNYKANVVLVIFLAVGESDCFVELGPLWNDFVDQIKSHTLGAGTKGTEREREAEHPEAEWDGVCLTDVVLIWIHVVLLDSAGQAQQLDQPAVVH